MGDTSNAIENQSGVRLGLVLAIEGYPNLLCDTLDTAAVIDAWSGTGWTQALPGLKVRGSIRQSITPWATTIDVPTLTFEIQATQDDLFGIHVWKSRPSFKTRLSAPYAADPDGSGVMDTVGNNGWTIDDDEPEVGGANILYVGTRRMTFASTSGGTQFNIAAGGSGTHQPFGASPGNHYSDQVSMPEDRNWDGGTPPVVANVPPTWIGKKVALYLHRIVGDTWDDRDEAQLEFAGTIVKIDDDPKTGATLIGCEDLRGRIRDAVLLKRQWVGHVKEGVRLDAGMYFVTHEMSTENGGAVSIGTSGSAAAFTVVASGASGTDQIDAGYYPLEEFIAALNTWIAQKPGTIVADWTFEIVNQEGGRRFQAKAAFLGAGNVYRQIKLYATHGEPLEFLGFRYENGGIERSGSSFGTRWVITGPPRPSTTGLIVSSGPPYITKPFQRYRHAFADGMSVEIESSDGEWVTHTDFLPSSPFDVWGEPGEDYSFLKLGDRLYFGRLASPTSLDNVSISVNLAGDMEGGGSMEFGRTVDDDDHRLDIFQVVVLAGSFADIFTRLIVSTDGRGVNHPDFDVFGKGMGCPGIPWSLLSDDWLESLRELDQVNREESTLVVLDRPTKLMDLLLPELLLRFAWIVFRNGHYVLRAPPTPNPIAADWVLDESNKAAPHDQQEMLLATTGVTKDHLCNVIKVEYNRTLDGSYASVLVVRDETSVATYGETQACTISAANSYADAAGTGASVESLASSLVARVLPAFARPMRTIRRTIAPSLYGMSPGDTVSLSDGLARDPDSGRRGIANRACICVAVTHSPSYGHEGASLFGEVELLFGDEDRTFPMAPAADVDTDFSGAVDGITFTSGYAATAAGGPALKLKAHSYSLSSDPTDASRFANADKVRIYEIDPSNPASITAWNRDLAASGAVDAADNYVRLTADLASPAYDAAKEYRVVPQLFSQVADSQKLVAYLAGADELVQDLIQHNSYGDEGGWTFARVAPDAHRFRLIPDEADDEGRPLHPGLVFDHYADLNSLISYVAAPHQAPLDETLHTSVDTDFRLIGVFPFFVGATPHKAARRRLYISPILGIANAAQTVSLRVTSSKLAPYGPSTLPPSWVGPKKQTTFTRTGSTAEAAVAVQSVLVVPADVPGCTWISIEMKTSSAAAQARFRGFQQLRLGPVEI